VFLFPTLNWNEFCCLKPGHLATLKGMIALPCFFDGSHLSTFSYASSCTCLYQLVLLTYCFKFIDSLMQGAWVSSYKQTDHFWPPIFRTTMLQQRDLSFRYSFCFPSIAIMGLHRNVLQEDDILCELYVDICSDVSDYSDNESLDSDSDFPATSSRKHLRSSTGPLTPQFPHPFFLTSIKTSFITVWD